MHEVHRYFSISNLGETSRLTSNEKKKNRKRLQVSNNFMTVGEHFLIPSAMNF